MDHLKNAREKVASTLTTISKIEQLDFPYDDSKEAIAVVKLKFNELDSSLSLLSNDSDAKTVRTVCRRVTESLFLYLPMLGFLARSTDVNSPLEFHGPFLRITRKLLGADARLIISSEWDFSPYTLIFPDLFGGYKYVMVALPATESENSLITPLAAHELGHNVWAKEGLQDEFGELAEKKVVELISTRYWSEFKATFKLDNTDQVIDLVGTQLWNNSWAWSVAQCEEMFCDTFALAMFRESYLLAFDYLLAPGLPERRETYPSMKSRINAMIAAANHFGVNVPEKFSERFDEDYCEGSPEKKLLLTISDETSNSLLNQILAVVETKLSETGLGNADSNSTSEVFDSIRKITPATHASGVDVIINGAWKFRNEGAWNKTILDGNINEATKRRILNDLVLKSFEVYEIEKLQGRGINDTRDKRNRRGTTGKRAKGSG